MVAFSANRVVENTSACVNEQILRRTRQSLDRCVAGGPTAIARRLRELDAEWDIERILETMAPALSLTGLFLGFLGQRRWFILPALVNGFFLQHAVQGWCPPLPVLRRMGFRTTEEIDRERYALKVLRGDFRYAPTIHKWEPGMAREALAAVDK